MRTAQSMCCSAEGHAATLLWSLQLLLLLLLL
jgi:hypothetical protein